MNILLRTTVAMIVIGLIVACASTNRFVWGDYENALYLYYKQPEYLDEYIRALEAAIVDGHAENKVAPGLLAELGYIYLVQGDSVRARELFQEEIDLFPESGVFLYGIIERSNLITPVGDTTS